MSIQRSAATALLVLLAGGPGIHAQDTGTITVEGTSTVRGWSCTATPEMTAEMTGRAGDILQGQASVTAFSVSVPVTALECGNGKMNDHLRKALKAAQHPTIRFVLDTYETAAAEEGATVTARGALTIAGDTRPIILRVAVVADGSGGLRARGEHRVLMPEFGVKPPSLMLGTMKVGEAVTVTFDVPVKNNYGNEGKGGS